ncbi:hypothetical protein BGZ54_010184 [Gamsiella multidivaricata]|nr:hypothetical protein BGZ54_010184 [Gamsiella multidivaricata]
MAEDVINSNFATVTMNFRTTDWLLPRGLQQNYGAGDYLEESQRIEPTTQELVKLNKDFIRCGSLATFNYINKIMAEHPSIYSDSEDIQIRRDILKTIVKGMHHWDDGLKDSDDSFSLALTTLEPLKTILGDNDAVIQRVEGLTAQKKGRGKDEDSSESASRSSTSCSTKPPKASKSDQQDVAGASKASTESKRTKVKQLTEATLGPDELQKEFDDQES